MSECGVLSRSRELQVRDMLFWGEISGSGGIRKVMSALSGFLRFDALSQ